MHKKWLVLAYIILSGCADSEVVTVDEAQLARVDRGRYLVNNVSQCNFCHTPLYPDGTRDFTRLLSGNACFIDNAPTMPGVGCLPTPNLTPHSTGLASWSDAEIIHAFRDGEDRFGRPLAAVMPYMVFHNMSDADAEAIVAYLRTIPPVNNAVPAPEPPWSLITEPAPFFTDESIPQPRPDYPNQEQAKAGRYLTSKVGLCIDCHTPDIPKTSPDAYLVLDRTRYFQGGRVFSSTGFGFQVPPYPARLATSNITPDPETGIGKYSVEQLVNLFHTGKDIRGDYVCAPTHGTPNSPYAGLTDEDMEAIANYLLSLAPANAPRPPSVPDCKAIQ